MYFTCKMHDWAFNFTPDILTLQCESNEIYFSPYFVSSASKAHQSMGSLREWWVDFSSSDVKFKERNADEGYLSIGADDFTDLTNKILQ